jgi:hypothetical protein
MQSNKPLLKILYTFVFIENIYGHYGIFVGENWWPSLCNKYRNVGCLREFIGLTVIIY